VDEAARAGAAPALVLLVTGVSGSGKSTLGQRLAERLERRFFDADDFHPAANVEKMRRCEPLTDADRLPWLDILRSDVVAPSLASGEACVLACSALKRAYRERLGAEDPRVRIIYLRGSTAVLRARLAQRRGHFMTAGMLDSQLRTLEEPLDALVVEIGAPPEAVVEEILRRLD
jgi:gluconokinase